MSNTLRIALAQINPMVGDIPGNTEKIIDYIRKARDTLQADLVVFPELSLTGYSPEDVLLRNDLYESVEKALGSIKRHSNAIDVLLGYPQKIGNLRYNAAVFMRKKIILDHYHKQYLPNYGVFDEKRYFTAGNKPMLIEIKQNLIGILICEDLWHPEPAQQIVHAGGALIITLNASPFDANKSAIRRALVQKRARELRCPILYLNSIGGQDELVFDGGSFAVDATGTIYAQAEYFQEALLEITLSTQAKLHFTTPPIKPPPPIDRTEHIYRALVLGVYDYVHKNGFPGVLIGVSGGIDSALTLAIAVDALGKEAVTAVQMPSRFTRTISLEDSEQLCKALGVGTHTISIEPLFNAFLAQLKETCSDAPHQQIMQENLQARCRGTLLMALSNARHQLVLCTGNKSELAVGYSTLYGDMAGGFSVLKDISKTQVYELAHYRNRATAVIPERIIHRPPSAELADNQKDEDTLPAYTLLDEIIERYIEQDQSIEDIVAAGLARSTVEKVVQLVLRNEYKRRQTAPGVRITQRAFGRDRRYPITIKHWIP